MHWIEPEERDDDPEKLETSSHDVAEEMLAMVVMPPIRDHLSHSEEVSKLMQTANALRSLRDSEFVSDLVPSSVAFSTLPVWLPDKADGEASFSVYKTSNPAALLDQPFLLVFRTRHIVTLDVASDVTSSAGSTGFSSI